jgi:hypothetical protein
MKERPILFTGDMVNAILDGRKTQTRRIIKPQPIIDEESGHVFSGDHKHMFKKCFLHAPWQNRFSLLCPYGRPGDIMYVRETWFLNGEEYIYLADGTCCQQFEQCECEEVGKPKWRPSIHMPKTAARIWLQTTDIRAERVQDISEEDARSEGVKPMDPLHPQHFRGPHHFAFGRLWRDIYGDDSWNRNDWVWVITSRVLSTTGRPAKFPALCAAP